MAVGPRCRYHNVAREYSIRIQNKSGTDERCRVHHPLGILRGRNVV